MRLGRDVFVALGVSPKGAGWMAEALTRAEARGHGSHGLMRISQYYEAVQIGEVMLGDEPVVKRTGPCTALIDAKMNFGQVVAHQAMTLCLEMAGETGIASVGVYNGTHIGRVADYTEMAAHSGMVGLAFVNGRRGGVVAPWGGRDGRLAPNPLAFACPGGDEGVVSVDITTSALPEGKIRLMHLLGQEAPADALVDADGLPTQDPGVLYQSPRGAILPIGGQLSGHKGFGLLMITDVLAGILARAGNEKPDWPGNGVLFITIDIERFLPTVAFVDDVDELSSRLKSSRPLPGFEEVLLPGERGIRTEKAAMQSGIEVDDSIWVQIRDAAAKVGVDTGPYEASVDQG